MRRHVRAWTLSALLALAVPALGQEGQQDQAGRQGAEQLDALFVLAAADGDMYEVESSQAVLAGAGDDQELADLAQRIIDDHTASSQRLQEIAAAAGFELPAEMSAAKRFKVEELRVLGRDMRVQAYLFQQELAHVDAIALFTSYAQLGANEELRTFAAQALPVLEEHLQAVQALRGTRPEPAGQEE